MTDYDKSIADAARELSAARLAYWGTSADALHSSDQEKLRLAFEVAVGKLSWMIDAEKHGWNPCDFSPECLN